MTPLDPEVAPDAVADSAFQPPSFWRRWQTWKKALFVLGVLIGVVLVVALLIALVPGPLPDLRSHPDPASDYAQALRRFEEYRAQESAVFERGGSLLMSHDETTEDAVVLIHSLSNSPREFLELAGVIYAKGANVLILRMPYHGLTAPDGESIGDVSILGALRPQDLRDYADDAVDIARGLGRNVRVMGLSAGGVVTAWIAQNRPDVERAVVVAPALTLPRGVPGILDYMFRNFFGRLPSISLDASATLDHAYGGESTRALAATYTMARFVRDQAEEAPPAAGSMAVVTNANDDRVDNDDVRRYLVQVWEQAGAQVDTYEFSADQGLIHDLVDLGRPGAQPEAVYPRLLMLLKLPAPRVGA